MKIGCWNLLQNWILAKACEPDATRSNTASITRTSSSLHRQSEPEIRPSLRHRESDFPGPAEARIVQIRRHAMQETSMTLRASLLHRRASPTAEDDCVLRRTNSS